ncbi:MAG: ABC transporter substrate-binding protein [Pirellulales bacterium]
MLVLNLVLNLVLAVSSAWAQSNPPRTAETQTVDASASKGKASGAAEPIDWLTAEPFDTITLNAQNQSLVLRVAPLELPNREVPQLPKRTGTLRLKMIDESGALYDLDWNAVESIELFEQRVLREAIALSESRNFLEAYRHFVFLFEKYPRLAGLNEAYEKFLVADALTSFREGRYEDSLVALGEVTRRRPGAADMESAVRRVVEKLLTDSFETGRYDQVRAELERFATRFGPAVAPTVEQWEAKLQQKARDSVAQAQQMTAAEQAADRRKLCHEALRAWPEVPGAQELLEQLYRENSVVRVGVRTLGSIIDPQRLTSWSAMRASSLTDRAVVEIRGFNDDGAAFVSRLGQLQSLPNQTGVQWVLDRQSSPPAFTVFQALRTKLDPSSPDVEPWLAASVRRFQPVDDQKLEVIWKRPGFDAFGLLNTSADWRGQPPATLAPYTRRESTTEPGLFSRRDEIRSGPDQIAEQLMQSNDDWRQLWDEGQMDVIDRIWPSERLAMKDWPDLKTVRYRFPSQHWLMFNRQQPRWQSKDLRRALLYGIDRQKLLDDVVLNGQQEPGCMVTSGPCPPGLNRDDPLGYGYLWELSPRPYDPLLASVLLRLYQTALAAAEGPATGKQPARTEDGKTQTPPTQTPPAQTQGADEAAQEGPQHEPLSIVLAHPADSLSTEICRLIAKGWKPIGVQCVLKPLPPDQTIPEGADWDLVFVDVRIREPFSDMHRLLGPSGQLPDAGPYVREAQQQLLLAADQAQARQALQRMQQAAYDDVAVLPLWQVVDFAAYRERLQGLSNDMIGLYDQVEKWSWSPSSGGEATR